jgi:zinc protease
MKVVKKLWLCLLALIIFADVSSQIDITQVMPLDPKVKIGRLPNGLTYYIRHNGLPEKRVELPWSFRRPAG